MTTIPLDRLRAFASVAARGSFTAAAGELGLDKSALSRQVRALEAQTGSLLLARTTRAVRLTPEGERLLARVAPHLDGLREALRDERRTDEPEGHVTVTTTADLAQLLLAPLLVSFRERAPRITVTVQVGTVVSDLLRAKVDLALRVGRPGGDSLVAKKVGEVAAGFFASPRYLARKGTPKTLQALAAHERLWPAPAPGRSAFASRNSAPPTVACDDFEVLLALSRSGGGVALLPDHLADAHVREGSLVRVLPEVRFGAAPLYLVSRAQRPAPARVALLRAHLLDGLRQRAR